MAMMASNGAVDVLAAAAPDGGDASDVKSDVEPRRSAAAPTMPVDDDCTWDAAYSLREGACCQHGSAAGRGGAPSKTHCLTAYGSS